MNPPRFCSKVCAIGFEQRGGRTVACAACGKPLWKTVFELEASLKHYCSSKCMGNGMLTGKEVPCEECGLKFYVSDHRLRRYRTFFHNNACRLKYQYRINTKSWRGFVESSIEYRRLADRIRKSAQVRAWKREVLSRDNSCCTNCNALKGLNVHHVLALVKIIADNDFNEEKIFKDPRLVDISNGVTLCDSCHANDHSTVPLHRNMEM